MRIILLRLPIISAIFALAEPCAAQTLTLINPGTDDRIQSITGLDIAGTTYDITFHHGVSFNSLTGSGSAITFTTLVEVTAAYNIIDDFIDTTNTNHPGIHTELIAVPHNSGVDGVIGFSATTNPYNFSDPTEIATFPSGITFTSNQAWLTFAASTTAVPEPTTFALAGALSVGAIVVRRRRKTSSRFDIGPRPAS